MRLKPRNKSIMSEFLPRRCHAHHHHLEISNYLPELQRARAARGKSLQDIKNDSMNRFMEDVTKDRARNPDSALHDQWNSDDDDAEDDINIIDKSMTTPAFLHHTFLTLI
jgi:hypothetical protein